MSTLDFSDREPDLNRTYVSDSESFSGNRAFYERLQGQTKKTGIERFGWVVRATSMSPCLLAFESCAHTTPNPLALRSEWKPAENGKPARGYK